MLDNRKSSITAKIAAQVVDYYKCASGIMVSGSPSTDAGSILDIVGSKVYKVFFIFIMTIINIYSFYCEHFNVEYLISEIIFDAVCT